jgi:hypothetical protein
MAVDIFSDEFARMVSEATDRARRELLASGVEVVYRDGLTGIDILERSDGCCFEIHFLPEGDPNYEILRELTDQQAA